VSQDIEIGCGSMVPARQTPVAGHGKRSKIGISKGRVL